MSVFRLGARFRSFRGPGFKVEGLGFGLRVQSPVPRLSWLTSEGTELLPASHGFFAGSSLKINRVVSLGKRRG